jgi:hypothetical protein
MIIAVLTLTNFWSQLMIHGFGRPTVKGLVPLFDFDGESNVPAFFPPFCS